MTKQPNDEGWWLGLQPEEITKNHKKTARIGHIYFTIISMMTLFISSGYRLMSHWDDWHSLTHSWCNEDIGSMDKAPWQLYFIPNWSFECSRSDQSCLRHFNWIKDFDNSILIRLKIFVDRIYLKDQMTIKCWQLLHNGFHVMSHDTCLDKVWEIINLLSWYINNVYRIFVILYHIYLFLYNLTY